MMVLPIVNFEAYKKSIMNKNIILCIVSTLLLFGGSHSVLAQQQLDTIWGKHFDNGARIETGYAIAQDGSNSVVIGTSVEGSPASNSKMYLIKIDSAGNKLGEVRYAFRPGSTDNPFNEGYAIVVVSDGYIVAGATRTALNNNWDGLVVKYNKSLVFQWAKTVGGTGSDIIYGMCITTGGRVIMSGTSISITTNTTGNNRKSRAFTLAFSSNTTSGSSSVDWANKRDHGAISGSTKDASVLYDIQPTDDGGAIAAGTIDMGADGQDYYLVKLNSSYSAAWSKNSGGAGDQIGKSAVEVVDFTSTSTPARNYIIGGYESVGANKFQPFLLKLRGSDRTQIFAKKYGVGRKTIYNIRKTSDNGIIAIGSFGDDKDGGKYHIYLHKFRNVVQPTTAAPINARIEWEGKVVGSPNGSGQAVIQASDNINFLVVGRNKAAVDGLQNDDHLYVAKVPPPCPCITIKVNWPYEAIGSRTDVQDDRYLFFDVYVTKSNGTGRSIYYGRTDEKGTKLLSGLAVNDVIEVVGVKYLADVEGSVTLTNANINSEELTISISPFTSRGF
jgi:hypothetical protein